MKTLIQKELRENLKLAVLGAGIFAFLLMTSYHHYSNYYADLASGDRSGFENPEMAQPLLGDVPKFTIVLGALFAAVLGWFQIHNERHRDLWAFLIHRPVSRTEIFAGKVIAGLFLYAMGIGLPLLGTILMIITPGHIAAPFEPAMLLPVTACFLSGALYYFAGMLTSLRQARWYVSRGMGLGLALLVSMSVFGMPHFWQVMFLVLLGGVVLATAAWGSFVSGGYYEGQPPAGRGALAICLMLGCFIVVMCGMALILSLGAPEFFENSFQWSRFQMTRDGAIYKLTQSAGKPVQITALNGKPLKDPHTGQPVTMDVFNRNLDQEASIWVNFDDPAEREKARPSFYANGGTYFTFWRQTRGVLWYWNRNGRLWAYDVASRRFLGSLGPNGFTPAVAFGSDRFRPEGQEGQYSGYYHSSYPACTLRTGTAVYKLDLDNRAASVLFRTGNDERIGGALDISTNGFDWNYTLVASEKTIRLLKPDGKAVWQTPFEPAYPDYNGVTLSFLEATNPYAVWFNPSFSTNELRHWTLPTRVVWLGADGAVLNSTNLPYLAGTRKWEPTLGGKLVRSVLPPSFYFAPAYVKGKTLFKDFPWEELRNSTVLAVVCVGIGWYLGRRNYFTLGCLLNWAGFILLFGLPGLLAFLCIEEWPSREPCPECKRLRFVNRERCEHCGAAFAPPPKNGTEIFAPLEPASGR